MGEDRRPLLLVVSEDIMDSGELKLPESTRDETTMETNQPNVVISDDGELTKLERFDDVRTMRYAEAVDSPTWRARRNPPGRAP